MSSSEEETTRSRRGGRTRTPIKYTQPSSSGSEEDAPFSDDGDSSEGFTPVKTTGTKKKKTQIEISDSEDEIPAKRKRATPAKKAPVILDSESEDEAPTKRKKATSAKKTTVILDSDEEETMPKSKRKKVQSDSESWNEDVSDDDSDVAVVEPPKRRTPAKTKPTATPKASTSKLNTTAKIAKASPKKTIPKKAIDSNLKKDDTENADGNDDDIDKKTATLKNTPKATDKVASKKKEVLSEIPLKMASSLPTTFMLQTDNNDFNMSGDTGSVGRVYVDNEKDNPLTLDLKGCVLKGKLYPCTSYFVVNVSQTDAKIESVIQTFFHPEETITMKKDNGYEGGYEGSYDNDDDYRDDNSASKDSRRIMTSAEQATAKKSKPTKKKKPVRKKKATKKK